MTQFLRFIKFFTIILVLLTSGKAQDSGKAEDLEEYIENSRQLFEVPGLAVGIIKDGKVVMNRGFGFRNASSREKADSLTVFGIASCSKAFTAACLAILVEDGALNWEDRVTDHYPDFQLYDSCATDQMQIQDLVCHRSGLQTFDGDLLWYGTTYTREEVVTRIRNREPSYSFRSHFGYQNVMYIAAGEVIKKASGKTWDEFIAERIFSPLGMSSSSTTNQGFNSSMNVAYPHIAGEPLEFLNYDNSGPAASINTCSDDLLKWVSLMLNKGSHGDQAVFSEDQYYKLTAPHTLLSAGRAEKIGGRHFYAYGLGWFLHDYQGRKIIQHGGGLPGFHSKVVLVPEDNLGFIIIANQLSGLVEALYEKILEHYLSETQTDWAAKYRQSERAREEATDLREQETTAARKTGSSPSLKLKAYGGTYEDVLYGKARVDFTNQSLQLTLLPSKKLFTAELKHWEDDVFRFTFNDPFLPDGYIHFKLNESKEVTAFTIDLKNPDFHFYKLDFKKID